MNTPQLMNVSEGKEDTYSGEKEQIVHRIKQINLCQSDTIHIGTKLTITGPVYIKNIEKEDILSVNDSCTGCIEWEMKKNRPLKLIDFEKINFNSKIEKIPIKRDKIRKNCSTSKCLSFGILITLIEIALISFHFLVIFYPEELKNVCEKKYEISISYEMNKNIRNFIPRMGWGLDNECTHSCSINVKTKIVFVSAAIIPHYCLGNGNPYFFRPVCLSGLIKEHKRHLSHSLNDIYYNYIIGLEGDIFEGRALECLFDEPNLPAGHNNNSNSNNSLITVGIIPCFFNNSYDEYFENCTQQNIQAINQLVNQLKRFKLLQDNFTLEFPNFINSSKLINKINCPTSNIKFYEPGSTWIDENYRDQEKDPYLFTLKTKFHFKFTLTEIFSKNNFCPKNGSNRMDNKLITTKNLTLNFSFMPYCNVLIQNFAEVLRKNYKVTVNYMMLVKYTERISEAELYRIIPLECSVIDSRENGKINIWILRDELNKTNSNTNMENMLELIIKDIHKKVDYINLRIEFCTDHDTLLRYLENSSKSELETAHSKALIVQKSENCN